MAYIPIVDISSILETGNESQMSTVSDSDVNLVAKQIGDALSKVGFVYLKNHGVDPEKIKDAFVESKIFFQQETEIKQKYRKDPKINVWGYVEPGQEILDADTVAELRESFDMKSTNLDKQIQEVPNFLSNLRALNLACKPLIHKLLKIFAKALELENENYFIEKSQGLMVDSDVPSLTTFRSIYYPPIPADLEITPTTVRCAQHSDYGILTLLFQDDVGGLEVKSVENSWVPANPIPGTILVNTGDLLEFWSGGYFPATVHRILIPDTDIKRRTERQSIAYFVHPDDSTIVSPLKTSGVQFEPVSAYDHAMMKLNRSYKY